MPLSGSRDAKSLACLALATYAAVVLRARGGADAIERRRPLLQRLLVFARLALKLQEEGGKSLEWCAGWARGAAAWLRCRLGQSPLVPAAPRLPNHLPSPPCPLAQAAAAQGVAHAAAVGV